MSKKGSPPSPNRREVAAADKYPGPLAADNQARVRRPLPVLAWGLSGAAHLAVFATLFWMPALPVEEPKSIPVTLVQLPAPEEPPGPVGPPGISAPAGPPEAAQAAAPTPEPVVPAPRPSPPEPVHILAAKAPTPEEDEHAVPDNSDILSDSQIAGAAGAGDSVGAGGGGGGGGGGQCNTARIVQQALRKDPLVRSAVEDAHRVGMAVMLWNGDWVRSGAQDGKGLSAVREAIMWEVAFAPEACRNQRMHGLVLLSLADGNTRFAIGSGEWRWADLLGVDR